MDRYNRCDFGRNGGECMRGFRVIGVTGRTTPGNEVYVILESEDAKTMLFGWMKVREEVRP